MDETTWIRSMRNSFTTPFNHMGEAMEIKLKTFNLCALSESPPWAAIPTSDYSKGSI